MAEQVTPSNYLELAAEIVSAYVANNSVPQSEVASLVGVVHGALDCTVKGVAAATEAPSTLTPAVPVKKSVTPDYIVCLEDGKKFKSLKRHLRMGYGITPEEYRAKWKLPQDYPMVAPNYAETRSALAKEMGLGQQRTKAVAKAAAPPAKVSGPAKGRARKKG